MKNKLVSIGLRLLNPFKSILDDPFYITLRNYHVIQVSGIIVSFYFMFYIINIYKNNIETISTEASATIFGLAGTAFVTIWAQLNSIYNNSKTQEPLI